MSQTPYQPPQAPLSDPQAPGSPIRAIITGTLFDLGATVLMSLVFFIGYSMFLASSGMSEAQITEQVSQFDNLSGWGLLLNLFGLAISVWAGYLCARIVQQQVVKTVAIMSVVIALASLLLGGGAGSPFYLVLSTLLTMLANVLGGVVYLYRK